MSALTEGHTVNRTLTLAFLLAGLAMPVHAADLDTGSLKDPLPDTLSWYGVTIYGNIDVGYAYQSHGVPSGGSFPQVLEYNIWNAKNANRTISTIAGDAPRSGCSATSTGSLAPHQPRR